MFGRVLASLVAAVVVAAAGPAPASAAAKTRDPVLRALAAAESGGRLAPAQAAAHRALYRRAGATLPKLTAVRRRELRSVVSVLRDTAERGALSADRIPLAFLTLQRNVQWWSSNGPPVAGSPGETAAQGRRCKPLGRAAALRARAARLTFPGSHVVWQYYPRLGLQLQVNGTFSAARALLGSSKPGAAAEAGAILDEMLPLASRRGGALTWEYRFPFGGGRPPWSSALSQASAIAAYTKAASVLGRPELLGVARAAAALFALRTPLGVSVPLGRDGTWYALYTFAPGLRVLNAHLNAVNALFDLAQATGDPRARSLMNRGLLALRRRIGRFDTGVWSRYAERGALANLNYHVLNRDLARGVCKRTGEPAVCRAADSFAAELERRCPRPTPAEAAAAAIAQAAEPTAMSPGRALAR